MASSESSIFQSLDEWLNYGGKVRDAVELAVGSVITAAGYAFDKVGKKIIDICNAIHPILKTRALSCVPVVGVVVGIYFAIKYIVAGQYKQAALETAAILTSGITSAVCSVINLLYDTIQTIFN